ncbi:tyrosine-protein phosphatase 99A-like [Pollicipes pollicipes]|uniref:tyrosine-protein phosphatase 99A-like n=1 Tax=Pollicipes pollicipes TaxID=41117 RepID=UPI001884A7EE|nr:tyrosine-protein phosphatase 99A-like [Pollicipes pollicipes]
MTEVRRTSRARLPQLALLVICIFPTGRGDRLMKTVVVRAGENATIPCPGLTEVGRAADYIIGRLTWTCPGRRPCPAAAPTGQLASYAARTVSIEGDRGRLDLDRRTWALLIAPARAADSGAYSCSFNDQPSDHRIVKLEVQGVPSPPGRPMVIKHTSRHIDLSWAPSLQTNNSPIKHYVIQTRYGDTGTWPAVEAGHRTAGSQTNATVADLTPFTVYTFRVVAANDMGYSRPSDASYPVSTLRERPGAPPKLTYARNRSSTSIEVGWRPPADHTLHGEFTGYHLTYRRAEPGRRSGPASSVQLHDVSDRSYFIEDLEPYTRYEITLQVKNPQDLGPPATITATTGEGVPSRPVNVSFSSVRDRSVVLRWVPPRRPNGLVRGYNAYWTADKGQVMRRAVPDGDRRTFTITNLDPDTEYSVWLKAVTGAGEGDRSFPVRARTDVSGPGAPVITNITCPTDTSLGLQWRKPEVVYGLVDLYYLLYRSGDSRDFIERMVPVQSDRLQYTINLPNLTANQVYEIRIQGATVSRLDRNKVYNGQQSLPRKVRMERGCEEIQLYSTWKHRPHTTLAGSEVTGIFVGCLLVLFLVIAAVIWRRRQKRYPAETADKMAASVAGSVLSGWGAPAHEAVPSHLFSQHVRQQHADADDGFRREWEMLQMAAPLADDARTSGAVQKNGQTAASDASTGSYYSARVPIASRLYRHRPTPAAYYVDGYQRARAFIVTDRPSAASHDALWRLVWEQGVTTLVLIGTLEPKGGRLWPERGAQRPFGDLQVEHREELPLAACCVRKLVVSKLKSKSSRSKKERGVNFFQYTYWPEFGLPEDTLPLLDFVQRTLQHESASNAPVLFISATSYCAAGLYVGLVSLLTQLKYRAELGVYSYWQHVIGQCPYLLTTVDEYSFLHDCLLERVTAGETLVPRN